MSSATKADYSRIASFFDHGRTLSVSSTQLWLDLIAAAASPAPATRFLDLGCGTGRFAIPVAARFGCRVTGADSSPDMLAKAQDKDGARLVAWQTANADSLQFADGSFDTIFMSHLLHHVSSPAGTLRECFRVLSPGGVILVRFGAVEHIRDDLEHRFFPETLTIDEPRSFSIARLETWLAEAGFAEITSTPVNQRTYESAQQHVEAIAAKATSVMTMISDAAYRAGLGRVRQYASEHAGDPWLTHDTITLTVGRKHV